MGPQDPAQHPGPPAACCSQGPSLLARQPEVVSLINPAVAPLRMLLPFSKRLLLCRLPFSDAADKKDPVLNAMPPDGCLAWVCTSTPSCPLLPPGRCPTLHPCFTTFVFQRDLRSFFHGNIIKMMLCTFSELPRHGTVLPRRQPCLPGWSLSFPSPEAAATSHRHLSQVPSSPCAFLAPALVYLTPNILLPLWKVTGEISWKKELLRAVSCSWGCTKPRDGCNHPRPAWRSWAEASPSLAGFSWCR